MYSFKKHITCQNLNINKFPRGVLDNNIISLLNVIVALNNFKNNRRKWIIVNVQFVMFVKQ